MQLCLVEEVFLGVVKKSAIALFMMELEYIVCIVEVKAIVCLRRLQLPQNLISMAVLVYVKNHK